MDIKPFDTEKLKTATLGDLDSEKKQENKIIPNKKEIKVEKPLVDNQKLENITSDISKDFEQMSYDPKIYE